MSFRNHFFHYKIFLSKYFWISFRKSIKFPAKQKSSFKANVCFMQRTPIPNPSSVKIKNVTQSKRCEIGFTQIFKERHHKRKESQGSNPKNCLPEEAPCGKPPKDTSLYESFDFSEGVIEVSKNCIFSWKSIWTDISDWVWRNIFCRPFSQSFFFGQGENTPRKKPRRNSVNENSSRVRRNTSLQERWKNYSKRRQSQTYT